MTENEKNGDKAESIQSLKDLFDEAELREEKSSEKSSGKKKSKTVKSDKKKKENENGEKVSPEEKLTDKTYKRVMLIVIPLIVVLAVVMAFMTVNLVKLLKKSPEQSGVSESYIYGTVTYAPETTAFNFDVPLTTDSSLNTTVGGALGSEENTTGATATTAATEKNVSSDDPVSWSKAQKLSYLSTAVNKTKKLGNSFSVHHTESFTANITECTGGTIGKAVANSLMGMVVKPVDETLSFSGGKAVNSEGEEIEILLPKKGAFSIDEAGVTKAVAYKSGNDTVIEVTLKEEIVGVYDVPKYNAGAVGYLDVNNFDLMGIEITEASIDYKASVISVRIGSDGYVKAAEYTIPLHVSGKGAKGSLSGYAVFDGEQRETWEF